MWRSINALSAAALISLAFTPARPCEAFTPARTPAVGLLRSLFANYAAIKTVSFRAVLSAGAVVPGHKWVPSIEAHYRFFADRLMYREHYFVEKPKALRSGDCITAFDGKLFQFLYLPARSLTISRKPPARAASPAMPNPLVLPLMFCARLPWQRMYSYPITWANFRAHSKRLLAAVLSEIRSGKAKFLPGRKGKPAVLRMHYGHQSFRVYFQNNPAFLPARIVLAFTGVRRRGVVDYQFVYRRYGSAAKPIYLPISVIGTAGGGRFRDVYRVSHVKVNRLIASRVFRIDFRHANIVVDNDTKTVMPVTR